MFRRVFRRHFKGYDYINIDLLKFFDSVKGDQKLKAIRNVNAMSCLYMTVTMHVSAVAHGLWYI